LLVWLNDEGLFFIQRNLWWIGLDLDYGPLGVELKNNVKREWWRSVVYDRDDMDGMDSAIIMNPLVWFYSGHVETFSDPLVTVESVRADYAPISCQMANARLAEAQT